MHAGRRDVGHVTYHHQRDRMEELASRHTGSPVSAVLCQLSSLQYRWRVKHSTVETHRQTCFKDF